MAKGRPYPPELKARLVIESLREDRTVAQVASENGVAPKLLSRWRTELLQNAGRVFSAGAGAAARERELAEHERRVDDLHRIIGQLTAERDHLQRAVRRPPWHRPRSTLGASWTRRTPLVSVRRQCELLGVPRSSYYYRPVERPAPPDAEREAVMAEIDDIHTDLPCYGARKISKELARRGYGGWTRCRVQGLMEEMGVRAVYPKPNTSARRREDRRFPYLLKNKAIRHPNQVWSSDITYVRCGGRHMYVYAIIDWHSRYIVGWDLLPDMGAEGVCRCMARAFEEHGTPGVANTDQGSVFASDEYVSLLAANHVPQSMDGKARWVDNVFIERWFRSLKFEQLRVYEYSTPAELRRLISEYVEQYNNERLHESLGYETPEEWYHCGLSVAA